MSTGSIPKIIHQIWWQGIDDIPQNYREYQITWRSNHINWDYMVWDKYKFEDLLHELDNPFFDKLYQGLHYMIQKIDLCKYIVLYTYGGVYTDMDTISEKSLEFLIRGIYKSLIVSKLRIYDVINYKLINNGIIISSKKHDFYKYLFDEISSNMTRKLYQNKDWYIMDSTGPLMFSRAVMYYIQESPKDDLHILDDKFLESCSISDIGGCKKRGIYITHFHDCSWISPVLRLHLYILKNYTKYSLYYKTFFVILCLIMLIILVY